MMLRSVVGFALAAFAMGALASAQAAQPPVEAAAVSAQWKAQRFDFAYTGFTTRYTCSGLEDKVREILLEFGARKDLSVRATGCEVGRNGQDYPSRFAWLNAQFHALEPAPAPGTAAGAPTVGTVPQETVTAHWTALAMAPKRPLYMDDGDCELADQLRDVLQKSFAMQDVDFQAGCTPHQITLGSYHLKAKVLKADKVKPQSPAAVSP